MPDSRSISGAVPAGSGSGVGSGVDAGFGTGVERMDGGRKKRKNKQTNQKPLLQPMHLSTWLLSSADAYSME